jgi:hypothetical protein
MDIVRGTVLWPYIFIIYLALALDVASIGGIWKMRKYGSTIKLDEINSILKAVLHIY